MPKGFTGCSASRRSEGVDEGHDRAVAPIVLSPRASRLCVAVFDRGDTFLAPPSATAVNRRPRCTASTRTGRQVSYSARSSWAEKNGDQPRSAREAACDVMGSHQRCATRNVDANGQAHLQRRHVRTTISWGTGNSTRRTTATQEISCCCGFHQPGETHDQPQSLRSLVGTRARSLCRRAAGFNRCARPLRPAAAPRSRSARRRACRAGRKAGRNPSRAARSSWWPGRRPGRRAC